MTKALRAKHVEGDRVRVGAGLSTKDKARFRIDKTTDEPRRRDPINAWPRAGDPQAVDVLARLPAALAASRSGVGPIGLSQQVLNLGSQRVLEEVDILKIQEPAANPIQAPARSS